MTILPRSSFLLLSEKLTWYLMVENNHHGIIQWFCAAGIWAAGNLVVFCWGLVWSGRIEMAFILLPGALSRFGQKAWLPWGPLPLHVIFWAFLWSFSRRVVDWIYSETQASKRLRKKLPVFSKARPRTGHASYPPFFIGPNNLTRVYIQGQGMGPRLLMGGVSKLCGHF